MEDWGWLCHFDLQAAMSNGMSIEKLGLLEAGTVKCCTGLATEIGGDISARQQGSRPHELGVQSGLG
jgi:hypothetical protein